MKKFVLLSLLVLSAVTLSAHVISDVKNMSQEQLAQLTHDQRESKLKALFSEFCDRSRSGSLRQYFEAAIRILKASSHDEHKHMADTLDKNKGMKSVGFRTALSFMKFRKYLTMQPMQLQEIVEFRIAQTA